MIFRTKLVLATTALLVWSPIQAKEATTLCVGKACLGMTVQEAVGLELLPAHLDFEFKRDRVESYGLDEKGNRIWIGSGGNFDKKSIKLFSRKIRTVCSMTNVVGWMQATDGRKIFVTFTPGFANGRSTMVISRIERVLALSASEAEQRELVHQAQQRYGAAFREWAVVKPDAPSAWIDVNFSHGRTLQLVLPKKDVKDALLSQPGCAKEASLD